MATTSGERPALLPVPTQEQVTPVSKLDLDDEKEARKLAQFCFKQARANSDIPSGPKWRAEGLKAQRLARAIRDRINEIEHDRELTEHERRMAGLGRRG